MGEQNEERDRESEKDRYFLAACNVMAYALFCFRLPIFNIILFVCLFFSCVFLKQEANTCINHPRNISKIKSNTFFSIIEIQTKQIKQNNKRKLNGKKDNEQIA